MGKIYAIPSAIDIVIKGEPNGHYTVSKLHFLSNDFIVNWNRPLHETNQGIKH